MNREGWGWHPLKGNLKGHWAVNVSAKLEISIHLSPEFFAKAQLQCDL